MPKLRWWLCGFLLLTANMYGQVDRGGLTGTVKDSSGLGVPGASVTAAQNATGLKRVAVTSSSGTYDIPELPVGIYTVTFALKGFQTVSFENLVVAVEHTTTLNAVLQVSGTTERIEVMGSAQQLDENSNTLGARVERKQVTELLLNGRNWATLTALAPLAVDTNYNSSSNQRSIRVAGRGRDDNNFTYDGIDATNIINQAQQPYVRLAIPLDTIQEFRVVSMLATAETGATAGGQMAVTSASGANQFHGSAFEFVRNDIFDAREFHRPYQAAVSLESVRRQLGRTHRARQNLFLCRLRGLSADFGTNPGGLRSNGRLSGTSGRSIARAHTFPECLPRGVIARRGQSRRVGIRRGWPPVRERGLRDDARGSPFLG